MPLPQASFWDICSHFYRRRREWWLSLTGLVKKLTDGICNYTKPLNIIVLQLLNITSLEALTITVSQWCGHSVVELLAGCLIFYMGVAAEPLQRKCILLYRFSEWLVLAITMALINFDSCSNLNCLPRYYMFRHSLCNLAVDLHLYLGNWSISSSRDLHCKQQKWIQTLLQSYIPVCLLFPDPIDRAMYTECRRHSGV
jgi:hypothetical protein